MESHRSHVTRRRTVIPFGIIAMMVLLVLILPTHILRSVVDNDITINLENKSSLLRTYSPQNILEIVNKNLNDLMIESNDDMDFESFLTAKSYSDTTRDVRPNLYQVVTTNPFIAAKKSSKFNSKAIRFYLEDSWLDSINETEGLSTSIYAAQKISNISQEIHDIKSALLGSEKNDSRKAS
jgi:hypothetical protein